VTLAGELVLIIEDNDKNLKLVRDVLQVNGFRTIEAISAAAGIELAADHHPDVILMDIQLPGMDGAEALTHLRARQATADIPVVAVTAFAMAGDEERFMAAGFDGYITKPISVRDFPGQVRSAARRGDKAS
jgi:two-component system cell cycle response regulator DivK